MISFSALTHTYTCARAYWIFLYFHTMSVIWHTDMLYHGVTGCNWCTTGCFFRVVQHHRVLLLQASHLLELTCEIQADNPLLSVSLYVEEHISDVTGSCWRLLHERTFIITWECVFNCYFFCINQNLSVKLLLTKWTLLSKWCFTSLNWR